MTTTATGTSRRLDGGRAGREAATKAADKLGTTDADLVLAFATTGYEQQQVLEGIGEVFDESPLSGSSTEGVITRGESCEDTHVVGVMALRSPDLEVQTLLAEGVSKGAEENARDLVDQMSDSSLSGGRLLMVFTPGFTSNTSEFVEELDELIPDDIEIVGGAAAHVLTEGEPTTTPTSQYCNRRAVHDSVAGVLIGGDFEVETSVNHGCVPIGVERTVTAAEGPVVYEIDGRPAWEVFRQYLPEDERNPGAGDLLYLSVGVKLPPEVAEAYDSEYIIRSPTRFHADEDALFFPGSLPEGAEISMVLRQPDRVGQTALKSARQLAGRRDESPDWVVQFDCAGRGRFLFGDELGDKAIRPVHGAFSDEVTWFGCHPYGEIAPVGGRTFFHNYTMVLCAVYSADGRS